MKTLDANGAVPRIIWIIGCLLPLIFGVYQATGYRTNLEIKSSELGVTVRVDDMEVTCPLNLKGLQKITLTATPSYFETGCEKLILTGSNGGEQNLAAPSRFKFSRVKVALTGDWWVDRTEEQETILIKKCDIEGSFSIAGIFTGRILKDCEIQLEGDAGCRVYFRGGTLNNDFGIILADGSVVAGQLIPQENRDLLRMSHYGFGALFGAGVLIVAFSLLQRIYPQGRSGDYSRVVWGWVAFISLAIGFVFSLWIARSVLDARPHFQDDMGYLLRAKWLMSGRLSLDVPEHAQHFTIPFTFFENNRWISQYTLGWPALLAVGQALGLVWIVGPVCGLVLGYFTWQLGTEVGGKRVGALAAALGVLSPMAQILAGSMLAHTASAMLSALFLWLYVTGWKDESRWWARLACAGLALGFALSIRPLSALSVAIPSALYGLAEMWRLKFGHRAWTGLLAVVIGGLAGSVPQFLDNYYITGNPLLFAYTLGPKITWSWGNYSDGLFLADHTMALVPDMAFGWFWPWISGGKLALLGFSFVVIVFITGRAQRLDWLLLGLCISFPVAYMGSNAGTGLHGFGPRYYSDVFFALFILTARGVVVLGNLYGGGGIKWRPLTALLIILTASAAITLPQRMSLYRGYNEADDRVEEMLSKAGIKRGLVLLSGPRHIMWVRAARLVPMDSRADLVFAESLADNRAIVEAYADRPVYVISDEGVKPYVAHAEPSPAQATINR